MKYIKKFETLNNLKFKKNDFVVAVDLDLNDNLLKNFLENNIGQIISIDNDTFSTKYFYEVYYNNVPNEVRSNFWMDDIYNYYENEIRLATPEEIDIFNNINKYNL